MRRLWIVAGTVFEAAPKNYPGAMAFTTFTDEEAAELYRLHCLYYREARRCETAKAYLAGCIMLGSALETMLMLMVNVYPEEAEQTGKTPCSRNRQVRPLREWKFIELLRVVKATGWLPSGLDVDTGKWDRGKARIGDYAEVACMIRNLVHPARYMADRPGGRTTHNRLRWQFEVVDLCRDWLLAHVHKSLRLDMEAAGPVAWSRFVMDLAGNPSSSVTRTPHTAIT